MYVEAESAVHEKLERREQIQALMAEVQRGDLVLVDKLDRWSRDPAFTYTSLRQILERGAAFYAIGDSCDPSTYEGDTMLNVRVLVAREEHKRIKQRMVGTRKLLRDRGYYVEGLPPWGYKRQAVKGAERNALIIDDEAAALVRRVFSLCVQGRSMNEIAAAVNETRDRVHDALHNRAYLGEVKNRAGEWIRAMHAPIIDAATFVEAQEAIKGRRWGSRPPEVGAFTSTWWLRDVARCALCGAKMGSAYGGKNKPTRRYYFRCTARCVPKFVRVDHSEAACDPLVLARLIELRDELAGAPKEASKRTDAASIDAQREKLQRKRARYLEAFAEGMMTNEELRAAMAKLDAERTKLDAAVHVPAPVSKEQRREALRSVEEMTRAWAKAPPRTKRALIRSLARAVKLAAEMEPSVEWFGADEIARRSA